MSILGLTIDNMPAQEQKPLVIHQQTAISIGLAIVLGGYAVWNSVQLTILQSANQNLQKEVAEMRSTYVSKNELQLTLQLIDNRLKNIEIAVTNPKNK